MITAGGRRRSGRASLKWDVHHMRDRNSLICMQITCMPGCRAGSPALLFLSLCFTTSSTKRAVPMTGKKTVCERPYEWMVTQRKLVAFGKGSSNAKALNYSLKHREALTRYLALARDAVHIMVATTRAPLPWQGSPAGCRTCIIRCPQPAESVLVNAETPPLRGGVSDAAGEPDDYLLSHGQSALSSAWSRFTV
ncbi:hypothetical protein ABH945_001823, partial [Paraburkholderia sp. GAS333]